MTIIKLTLIIIAGLGIGAALAYFYPPVRGLTLGADTILSPIIPMKMATEQTQVKKIGFLPYWLLTKATDDYSKTINQISYYGLTIGSDGHIQKKENAREEEPGWTHLKNGDVDSAFTAGKQKSLLVFSGSDIAISEMLEDPTTHAQNLIDDVEPIMKQYGFTDLNLDVETVMDASASAKQSFTSFAKTIKEGLNQRNLGTLSIDVIPRGLYDDYITDIPELGTFADYIIFMMYDFHYSGSYVSGPVAPLNGSGTVAEFDIASTLENTIKVIPPHKIILGAPTYGYEWETLSAVPGSAVIPGSGVTASNARVQQLLHDCKNCTKGIDQTAKQPYVIYPADDTNTYYKQIYYEDADSLAYKAGLVKQYKLGGIALWALGYEGEHMLDSLKNL